MRNPFVIAEFSGCHDCDLTRMLRGVDAAAAADADAFKTWWCASAERAAARVHAPELVESYRVGEFPRGWLPVVAAHAHHRGLEFLCTVDCSEDIPVIAPHVDRFKVASWGSTDAAFLEAHDGKPLIISTGATARMPSTFAAWLHCVSAYPAPLEDCNLAVLRSYGLDGFSDHTKHVLTGALAVAAGARILEVHFCLPDTAPDHPDRVVSHEPAALAEYIRLARLAATAMGDGVKRVMPSEEPYVRHRYVS